ncbi:electron transfer flavoprotein subunit alpha/FixB family protein [Candidatus Zixiibacteriota bacterium]
MKEILVLAEHRSGELRDVTLEMLTKGRQLAEAHDAQLVTALLGHDLTDFSQKLKRWANQVIVIEDLKLENFNADAYQQVLSALIKDRQPALTLIGHTSFGVDLAPVLATELGLPLITDCIDLQLKDGAPLAIRQVYGGKLSAEVSFVESPCMATLRQGAFALEEKDLGGEILKVDSPLTEEIAYRKFLKYIEAVIGDVDITQAEILISVGRGIKEEKNMPVVEELAKAMGGVLSCSRPVTDSGWLPSDRQVGQSGRTVKPKLYVAVGISGAFQHIAGMGGSDTIVAINKDPNAPIFSVAQYGIVGDLFQVVPALTEKIAEMKGN